MNLRRRLFVVLAVVPLVVSVHGRRAGADSYCDQECDHEPGGCDGKQTDDCYASCQTERDEQLSHSSSTPPPSPSDLGDDDAGVRD